MLPHLTRRAPWFAWIAHFRGLDDLRRSVGSQFLRSYSADDEEFQSKACSLPPVVIGEVVFGFAPIRGEIIAVMRMPHQMAGLPGRQATLEGVKLAVARGARVIGLGALTAPATGGGLTALPLVSIGMSLTNGNAYTAAVVWHNVREAIFSKRFSRQARVAVVGCTGSVGYAVSHLLADDGFDLVLVGRKEERARSLLSDLEGKATFAGSLAAVSDADVVILLTNDPAARLLPDHVAPGSVVIDVAQPLNVPISDHDLFRRRGIAIAEGGVVSIPDYASSYDLGLPNPRNTYACLAETYLFAREGIRMNSVGRPTANFARQLDQIAGRRGLEPTPLNLSTASIVSPHVLPTATSSANTRSESLVAPV